MELLRAEIGAAAPSKACQGEGHAEKLRVDGLRKKYQEALVGMRSQQEKALLNIERRHRAALQEQVSALRAVPYAKFWCSTFSAAFFDTTFSCMWHWPEVMWD